MLRKIQMIPLTMAFLILIAMAAPRTAQAASVEAPRDYDRNVRVGGVDVRTIVTLQPTPTPASARPTPSAGAKTPSGKSTRASLAVLPFSIAAKDYWKHFEKNDVGLLTDKLIAAMVKTRKFDVIERRKLDKILDEQKLSATGMTDPARSIEMGRLIGADYLIMGTISTFSTGVEHRKIPYTTRLHEILRANIIVDMRIVDSRTGKIVSAEKGNIGYEDKSIVTEQRNVKVPARFLDELQRALIDQLVQKTIDAIYPVKVVSVTGGIVFLNRGSGGGLRVGDLWNVYAKGKEIRDPDTGEILGAEEFELGAIQVTQVLPNFSKAVTVKGSSNYPDGSLCRRARVDAALPENSGNATPPRSQPNWQ